MGLERGIVFSASSPEPPWTTYFMLFRPDFTGLGSWVLAVRQLARGNCPWPCSVVSPMTVLVAR